MKFLCLLLILVGILFLGSNCTKENYDSYCQKLWNKEFLTSVVVDTSNNLSLILPDSVIPGKNAVLWMDSIVGDFHIEIEVRDFEFGNSRGPYFRAMLSNGPASQPHTVSLNAFTQSDSFNVLHIAPIIDSSGNNPKGDFAYYEDARYMHSYTIQIERSDSIVWCYINAFDAKGISGSVSSRKWGVFNSDPCKLSLELGSNNSTTIKEKVSIRLASFVYRKRGSYSGTYDHFTCNSIY